MTKGFYDFNIILTLELIIINFKKKLPKNLLVSFIFITLSYVNKKKQYYEQRRKSN